MSDITLRLSIEEANLVLEALGNLPFVKVYALIDKIQAQAVQQVGKHHHVEDHDLSQDALVDNSSGRSTRNGAMPNGATP